MTEKMRDGLASCSALMIKSSRLKRGSIVPQRLRGTSFLSTIDKNRQVSIRYLSSFYVYNKFYSLRRSGFRCGAMLPGKAFLCDYDSKSGPVKARPRKDFREFQVGGAPPLRVCHYKDAFRFRKTRFSTPVLLLVPSSTSVTSPGPALFHYFILWVIAALSTAPAWVDFSFIHKNGWDAVETLVRFDT